MYKRQAVYSACKGGMIAFTKTVARELVSKGIIVNTICPGPTDTAILKSFLEGPDGTKIAEGLKRAIPMRRLGAPEDYPGLVARAGQHDHRHRLVPAGALQRIDQLFASVRRKRVVLVGAVDGDARHAVAHLEQKVFVLCHELPVHREAA